MKHFDAPQRMLAGLDAHAMATLIAAASDVALIVDAQGVIRDVAVGGDDFDASTCSTWVGQPWADTVTVESRPKVIALLDKAKAAEPSARRWRHINHPSGQGADLPVLYSAVSYGDAGRIVAFGRDLRAASQLQQRLIEAQQSLERDYLRLRHMETRYRHLFQKVSDAILIVDAQSLKVSELNPAAESLLGAQAAKVVGDPVNACFAEADRDRVAALLGGVRLSGQAEDVRARLEGGGREVLLHASLFRQAEGSTLLVRLAPTDGAAQPAARSSTHAMLLELVDRVPDGFVVTDLQGTVLAANSAFVEMTQLAAREQVIDQNLSRWLGRSEVDLSVLLSNLKQHGSLRLFATTVRGQYGVTSDVEISAAALPGGEHPCLGFTIRDVGRRLSNDTLKRRELPRSASQLIELVGRVPLKDIVGETTDLIEQMCIEAALELTRDNRASASEMLGLSRQSLYVKLRRYGLGDLGAESDKQ